MAGHIYITFLAYLFSSSFFLHGVLIARQQQLSFLFYCLYSVWSHLPFCQPLWPEKENNNQEVSRNGSSFRTNRPKEEKTI